MTRRRLVALALAAWLIALGFALQPHSNQPLHVLHAHPLDAGDNDLPTLPPLPR